jgi:hypothetical protein
VLSLTQRWSGKLTASAFTLRQDGPFTFDMRGASAHLESSIRRETRSARMAAGGSWSTSRAPDDANRWLYFLDEALSFSRYRNGRRTTLSLTNHLGRGKRDNADIDRFIVGGGITSTEVPFSFTAQFGRAPRSTPEPFVIGGNPPTLAPPGLLTQYVPQPALSPFFVGSDFQTLRFAIPFGGVSLYDWLGRAYTGSAPRFEHVIGAEWGASIMAIPVLGTPAGRITVGAGRWMNRRDVLRQNLGDPAVYVTPSGKIQFYITTQFGDWAR